MPQSIDLMPRTMADGAARRENAPPRTFGEAIEPAGSLHELASSAERLSRTVVEGGYCIGCGGCSVGQDPAFSIGFDRHGFLQATRTAAASEAIDYQALCPFSGTSRDETDLALTQFGDTPRDERVGHYLGLYAGHLAESADRERGSSGGLTSWVLRELLRRGIVDHVVHVRPVDPRGESDGRILRYGISSTVEDLDTGRGSHYYPVEMSGVLEEMRRRPGRYAVVAIPCFAKTLRLAAANDPVLDERIAVVVGLVCGHLKSRAFADYLGWLVGVRPAALQAINFRRKLVGVTASQYAVTATGPEGPRTGLPVEEYFGTSWDLGFFKYKACDFCDDVFAETADIVMGDAWIEPYASDWRGTNVVVVRRPDLHALLREGRDRGDIVLDSVSLEDMARSQAAGLRHRREGLLVRLRREDARGAWRPRKRFEHQASTDDAHRRYIYTARQRLASQSVNAFTMARTLGLLNVFYTTMSLPVFTFFLRRENLNRALRETVAAKWLKRILRRRRSAKSQS